MIDRFEYRLIRAWTALLLTCLTWLAAGCSTPKPSQPPESCDKQTLVTDIDSDCNDILGCLPKLDNQVNLDTVCLGVQDAARVLDPDHITCPVFDIDAEKSYIRQTCAFIQQQVQDPSGLSCDTLETVVRDLNRGINLGCGGLAEDEATHVLLFDPTGRNPVRFQVPEDKRVYLVRAPQVSEGTATVQDVLALENYVIPNEVTVCETTIAAGSDVALAFVARSNQDIQSVNAEVISPRQGIRRCN